MRTDPLDKVAPAKDGALSSQVFYRIRQWIREGRLKEGDPLPSERELALTFDVSRVPVREAIKVLEFIGAAERVAGKGVVIRRVGVPNLISNIDFVLMGPERNLVELFEAREGIEIQAAGLAAARRTDPDLAAMEAAIASMERRMREGREFLDTSMGFHTAVIAASHNRVIGEVNLYLADWLRIARRRFLERSTLHDEGLHEHREILDRIAVRDAAGAERAMKEHLERTRAVIVAAMEECG